MTEIPSALRYSADHLWARSEGDGGLAKVGLTDYAQDMLGEVLTVTLPEAGRTVASGESFGEIESVKSISELIAPLDGVVEARNHVLTCRPEIVNQDPYGDGWLIELRGDPDGVSAQLANLLDASAYAKLVAE
jgi:glycine cleavage system H protein